MTFFIILSVVLIAILLYLVFLLKKQSQLYGTIQQLQRQKDIAKDDINHYEKEIEKLFNSKECQQSQLNQLNRDIEIAELKRKQAIEIAEKDLTIENERRKAEFKQQLDDEMIKLKEDHPVMHYQRLLDNLNDEITKRKNDLKILQEQALQEEEKENFNEVHSLKLSETDIADIKLIKQFATNLHRRDALYKLIWSEYYQGLLQALRKTLSADKKTGIYKITEKATNKCYIGQALDIGTRWTDHVKAGLRIGSTSYMSNRFYSALDSKGAEAFTFEILEECPKEILNERESYWINFYDSTKFGFNTKKGSGT